MEWMVTNSQLHSTFSLLGSRVEDTYHANDACLDNLKEILNKLVNENRVHRQYRRAIGFSQMIKKDLLPLLCSIKEDNKMIDLVVRILGNLAIPVECLLDVDSVLKTDTGRTIIYELNWLLTSCKEAFLNPRSTRAILDYIKHVLDKDEHLSLDECDSINNCLLLLRNILHIPEVRGGVPGNGVSHQNQIVWNLFTQNMDKVLIQLMTGGNRKQWVVAVVQLIALMYKDQHVGALQKLLNMWFEASISESSEDNESNTSPPDQGSGDSSSSMMMSDPTSDSSDNGGSRDRQQKISKMDGGDNLKNNNNSNTENKQGHNNRPLNHKNQSSTRKHFLSNKLQGKKERGSDNSDTSHYDLKSHHSIRSWTSSESGPSTRGGSTTNVLKKECASSEQSDCGYGTQVENQESISTSSNEDDGPNPKPIHQKPSHLIQKSRYSKSKSVPVSPHEKKEWRRKKLIKRSKTNTMNMKALLHHTPSEEDVCHLLKEFTVDFLLKGYAHLVQELRGQLLTNTQPQIDTSHFFWVITYFLKFAAQLELDLEHISSVLSFEVVSYLTYEGVDLCEQLQLVKTQFHNDPTPCLRRIHLVVTALREVIQTIETYKKIPHLSQEDENQLLELQTKICSTVDLKNLFVMLIRQFDPTIQSKQYLQDIIITNHMFLIFIEKATTSSTLLPPRFTRTSMAEHIAQFACPEVMKTYGLLLECYEENGEYLNNCIFTMMHHIAGDINQAETLFQPCTLKTFFKIWESDFEICDDWSDLIEYVIHKFINVKHDPSTHNENGSNSDKLSDSKGCLPISGWSKDDSKNLYWYYVQSEKSLDPIGKVLDHYTESGVRNKTRIGVIEQLLKQEVINGIQFDEFMKKEPDYGPDDNKMEKEEEIKYDNKVLDEIRVLRDHLISENKEKFVTWLKHTLLEVCYAKLSLAGKGSYVVEPVAYHFSLLKQSVPLVPWNSEQCNILQYQPFVLLLHKLGLNFPSDTGKLYIRIPNFWTPEILYSMAQKLSPIKQYELKFDASDLQVSNNSLWLTELEPTSGESLDTLFNISCTKGTSSFIGYTPGPNLSTDWMGIIQTAKSTALESHPSPEDIEVASVNGDTDTDLTRMCVSDEEPAVPSESTS